MIDIRRHDQELQRETMRMIKEHLSQRSRKKRINPDQKIYRRVKEMVKKHCKERSEGIDLAD